MVAIIIVFICVAIPVGGGLGLAAWRELLHSRPPDPIAILGARYANGEIDETEYNRRMQILLGSYSPGLPPG